MLQQEREFRGHVASLDSTKTAGPVTVGPTAPLARLHSKGVFLHGSKHPVHVAVEPDVVTIPPREATSFPQGVLHLLHYLPDPGMQH